MSPAMRRAVIVRDSYGVPSIYSRSTAGMWFGAGWAQAQDRSHYVQGTISYTVPGFFGRARVVYEFVTTGMRIARGGCPCRARDPRPAASARTAGGAAAELRVTAGALSGGNSSVGVVSCRSGLIVWPPAARVAATGTT